ncbi:Metallocarboxypeptidase [Thalictrum thalictroides]|uniref:Metallocarboxypeptidase n=1 Tax=Thalictrum thalictroides TaxID=46969 RepID=A0A7J6W9D8_THATH|nr:Metallocarboxypeptidase [Thalictrum thalictroides]
MKNSVSISSDRKQDCVVCPKPRRLGILNHSMNDPIRTLRWQLSLQTEVNDSKAGNELMEIILSKGGNGTEHSSSTTQVASSPPPFFCGSPPSRATNPLIQDARFGEEKLLTPLSPLSIHTSSPSSSMRKVGCVRAKFGHKPAPVRVEGFDCLDRDRRNCSIPAVA